ncbi:MAG: tautomerase family protein [Clostridium sp.]|nr:tautomerase family protein [Clostridium sp.]
MPTIFFYGPKLSTEKKKILIKEFTEAASHATGLSQNSFVVYLLDVAREDVGVGGELLSEKTNNIS